MGLIRMSLPFKCAIIPPQFAHPGKASCGRYLLSVPLRESGIPQGSRLRAHVLRQHIVRTFQVPGRVLSGQNTEMPKSGSPALGKLAMDWDQTVLKCKILRANSSEVSLPFIGGSEVGTDPSQTWEDCLTIHDSSGKLPIPLSPNPHMALCYFAAESERREGGADGVTAH